MTRGRYTMEINERSMVMVAGITALSRGVTCFTPPPRGVW